MKFPESKVVTLQARSLIKLQTFKVFLYQKENALYSRVLSNVIDEKTKTLILSGCCFSVFFTLESDHRRQYRNVFI